MSIFTFSKVDDLSLNDNDYVLRAFCAATSALAAQLTAEGRHKKLRLPFSFTLLFISLVFFFCLWKQNRDF